VTVTKNLIIPGSGGKPIALDIFHNGKEQRPVVIYAHGFNGFKDWANFDLIADRFAEAGFTFIKFNFSHNGTSPSHPEEFVDLEAFGQNNYTKQLEDLGLVLDWVSDPYNIYNASIDANQISLIGHSMGGGIAILQAAKNPRVKKLITWASIAECKTPWGNWPAERIEAWRKSGVEYYANSRTQQQMPLYFQLYEDYQNHKEALNIEKAMKQLNIPILICHGTQDTAVPVEKAHLLQTWQPKATLFTVDSDHVFGRSHPWGRKELPEPMEEVVKASIKFLKN
jgi:dienelactone hydrolase